MPNGGTAINDNNPSFSATTRRIAFAIFPQFQLMDVAGPIAAFDFANLVSPGAYALTICAPTDGLVRSSAGVTMEAAAYGHGPFDTLIVSGGYGLGDPGNLSAVAQWLVREAPAARRVASVCVGSYALAEAGLLNGMRATTHWGWIDDFAQRYPNVIVDRNAVFLTQGKYWTSAGISAGIEMAIALIQDDLGADTARAVTQEMFVHTRSADGHVEPSWLQATGGAPKRFDALRMWMRANLAKPMNVEFLADKMGMSARTFARLFREETGSTPAKAVERMRIEAARAMLSTGASSMEAVAEAAGFGNAERMRRAFQRFCGEPPKTIRQAARVLVKKADPLGHVLQM
jgi:Transcriptional regulator containing an amidase domain and an AraC-type DNA-binding HTH domain